MIELENQINQGLNALLFLIEMEFNDLNNNING